VSIELAELSAKLNRETVALQQEELKRLESNIALAHKLVTEVLDHVEDLRVKRQGNECTLCFNYRSKLRDALYALNPSVFRAVLP